MLNDNKAVLGRISGIPIVIDATLILLIVLYGSAYFTAGSPVRMAQGAVIVAGGLGSILLHELAHAWAGRFVRCEPTHIELNGLGGLCFFGRARMNASEDIFVTLAGPAANFALWAVFYWLDYGASAIFYGWYYDDAIENIAQVPFYNLYANVSMVLSTLAALNISMFVFNLMPSFPLDGGSALSAFLSKRVGAATAVQTVASLGYIVCALCVYAAVKGNYFMLVMAYTLFMANHHHASTYGRQTWTRWN